MPRPCGPCGDKLRNELDRRLLNMEITGETYRSIALDFDYSEHALIRHKTKHLRAALLDVKAAMESARQEELARIREEEKAQVIADAADKAKESMAARLEAASDLFGQLSILRERAAVALEKAESAENIKAALQAIREIRETVRLWGELEGKLQAQPQITIINNPEWVELRTVIIQALDDFPQAREAVVNAIRGR